MNTDQEFVRCSHCRGFYEADRGRCKWCGYDTVFADNEGKPIVYPDRQTVRAIQIGEYEQLPAQAHADYMRPPANNLTLICGCLHCGQGGHAFEAVEMRWLANERMWACPCTTCGGRGFQVDIHPIEPVWQCAECGHWYTPQKFTSKYANCPKCGSKYANGWFDDEDEDEEEEELTPAGDAVVSDVQEEVVPWDDDESTDHTVDWAQETQPWYPGKDEDDDAAEYGERPMPDDIDFPRHFDRDQPAPDRPADASDEDVPY
jgi:predicted  nucleic acid-binding Zn-ribbon protein